MLTKRGVSIILVAHLVLVWGAVAVRIDYFPMTWAPMYAIFSSKSRAVESSKSSDAIDHAGAASEKTQRPRRKFMLKDKDRVEQEGWLATRRDGSTLNVGRQDINVPRRSMWRLYYERSFRSGPPKYKHMNYDAGTWDRWLRGLEPGEALVTVDWDHRLLESINKTLGLRPDDSDFIVSLDAYYDSTIIHEDGSSSVEERTRQRTVRWNEAWSEEPW